MKGNETWLCVQWAARGQLSNVSSFGLESSEMEGDREKKSPLLWLKGISAPHMHRSWMSLSQLPTRHSVNHHQQHSLLCHLPSFMFILSVCLSVYTPGFPFTGFFLFIFLNNFKSCLDDVRCYCYIRVTSYKLYFTHTQLLALQNTMAYCNRIIPPRQWRTTPDV